MFIQLGIQNMLPSICSWNSVLSYFNQHVQCWQMWSIVVEHITSYIGWWVVFFLRGGGVLFFVLKKGPNCRLWICIWVSLENWWKLMSWCKFRFKHQLCIRNTPTDQTVHCIEVSLYCVFLILLLTLSEACNVHF